MWNCAIQTHVQPQKMERYSRGSIFSIHEVPGGRSARRLRPDMQVWQTRLPWQVYQHLPTLLQIERPLLPPLRTSDEWSVDKTVSSNLSCTRTSIEEALVHITKTAPLHLLTLSIDNVICEVYNVRGCNAVMTL